MSEAMDIDTEIATAKAPVASFRGPTRVMAFVADDVTEQVLGRVAQELDWRQPQIEVGTISDAIDALASVPSPDLLFVDLGETSDPMGDINALADVCEAGTRVVALGNVNDVKLFRALTDSGVADYLLKPVAAADVVKSVHTAFGEGTPVVTRHGQLVVVSGARGGVGASVIATSLAWCASEKSAMSTALLDFDVQFGTAALAFDLEPGTGLTDILADPDRIDPLFLERASIKASDNLSLFATEAALGEMPPIERGAVEVLLDELLRTFDAVVVDAPRDSLMNHSSLITRAEEVVLVTDLSLSAMRDCLRFKQFMSDLGTGSKLKLVANETRLATRADLAAKEFANSVGQPFVVTLPYDRKSVAAMATRGKPLAAGSSPIAKAIRRFGDQVFAPKGAKGKKSGRGFSFLSKRTR